MIFSMDLNASPFPEEDEQPNEEPVGVDYAHVEHVESAVAAIQREHEEGNYKLKRECGMSVQGHIERRLEMIVYLKAKLVELSQRWTETSCLLHKVCLSRLRCLQCPDLSPLNRHSQGHVCTMS